MAGFPLPPQRRVFFCIAGNFNWGSIDLSISGLVALWVHGEESP